jgi:hypothetical protein
LRREGVEVGKWLRGKGRKRISERDQAELFSEGK